MAAPIVHEGFIDSKNPEKVRSLSNFKIRNPNGGGRAILVSFSENFRESSIPVSECPSAPQLKFSMGVKPRHKSGGANTHKEPKKKRPPRT